MNLARTPRFVVLLVCLVTAGAGALFAQADPAIVISHAGSFVQGQTGATYTIVVNNIGTDVIPPDTGFTPVTVRVTIPTGLTATNIQGINWTCAEPAGPCARVGVSAYLLPGDSYEPLILTVNVPDNAPPTVVTTAAVSFSADYNTTNNVSNDPTNIYIAAAPIITSLGSSFTPDTVPFFPAAITSATPVDTFKLYITGLNIDPREITSVTWFNTATNQTAIFSGASLTVTFGQVVVVIPGTLVATPVSSPVNVQITLSQQIPTFGSAEPLSLGGRATLRAGARISPQAGTSNTAIFVINPPLATLGPNLPTATPNTPYSQKFFTGGTPTYQFRLNSGALPPGLAVSTDGTTIVGTPTASGTFNFNATTIDIWNNRLTSDYTILVGAGGPTITSVVPNSAPAGISSVQITVNGTNFTANPVSPVVTPGSVVMWSAPGSGPVALATTFVSATQLTATIPGSLLQNPLTATINVSQSGGVAVAAPVISNGVPFTVSAPSITALVPAGATAGAQGFTLTVNGASFVNNSQPAASSQVTFGGTQLTTTFVNSGSLTVAITAAMIATPGSISVVVTNPGGSRSNTATFTVFPGPTLLSINPNSANAGGPAFTLTATGTNFATGMAIRWNGTALPTTCVGAATGAPPLTACASNQLTTTVPANLIASPGTASVSVATADGIVTPSLPFTIRPKLQITTTTLPDGSTTAPYSYTLAAVGGVGSLNWSATGLPGGLQINAASGTISGTPAANGTYSVSVSVTDQSSQSASAQFSLFVGIRFIITTTALPSGSVGKSYSFTLTASGGTLPLVWSATLPSGLFLNAATGAITGTPASTGTFTVPVSVNDSSGQTTSARFLLVVLNPLVITTAALPSGTLGASYSAPLTATGGVPPDLWSATGLPPGLAITSAAPTCVPFPAGFVPFDSVAYVTQANGAGDLLLVGSMSSANYATLQNLPLPTQPNQQFCSTVQLANGFSAIAYVPTAAERFGDFSPFAGLLVDPQTNQPIPGGIIPIVKIPTLFAWRISPGASNPGTATISGIPTLAGSFSVTLTVSDTSGLSATATLPLIILPSFTLAPATLPNGATGAPYSFSFTAIGGLAPLTWSAAGVPPGLAINTASGVLSGIPTAPGTFAITVMVKDSGGQSATRAYSLTIISRLTITSGNLPPATTNAPYSFRLTATGGVPPYTWSATGLAPGLILNPQTGDITGTPTSSSAGTVSVTVTDQAGQIASSQFPFSVAPPTPAPLQIVTNSLPAGTVSVAYGVALAASGGTPDYSFSVVGGALPAGLTLSSIGFIGGTPTAPGQFNVVIRVTDSAGGAANKSFTILINPAPLTVTGTVNDLVLGADFSFKFGATGGVPPYVFGAGGAIPGGRFTSDGTLAGTATSLGTFTFNVSVTDSTGASSSKSFTVKVTASPLTITTSSLGAASVGVPFSAPFAATGGVPPYTWAANGGPAGVTFSGNILSGTPTAAGTFTIAVTVIDSDGTTATKSFSLVVSSQLQITTTALGDGVVGSPYSASLAATGGAPPYSFSVTGLPDGISAASTGALSGTPTARGSFAVSAKVTDSTGNTTTKAFNLTVAAAPLVITTTTLPNVTVGTAYSASLQATGGVPPYSWVGTGLPNGIGLGADGTLSGTATAAGASSLGVTVTDSAGSNGKAGISLTAVLPPSPNVTVTGAPPTTTSASQSTLRVSLDRTFPVAVTVTLTLTAAPVAGTPPQDAQFANGTQTFSYVVPPNTAPTPTDVPLQVGTVAGTITITEKLTSGTGDLTPSPAPVQTITVGPSVPVLTGTPSVTATRNATGFTVVATGYSNTREIAQAVFQFTAAAGTSLQTSTVTISGDSLFAPYFASAASNATGGSFKLTQPFTIQGNQTGIVSVTLTLVNRIGSSQPATANLQ